MTLVKSLDDMLSHARRKNTLNSHSAFFTHSAVYILYLVYILYPVCGLQSAFWVKFPHSPILHYAFSFWIEETMIKNNILSLGKQICFTIV